ncbi:MAG: isopentenyl-diphosphate Delta-isomerase [Gammaproteobacteria bacterium]|nr:isopentenyl-diphosphate Delta-isomerase [Gammaproteobacteria bacterium]
MNDATRSEVVSSDDEPLILVDTEDRQIGTLDKAACHDGQGRLHRAFSLFVFNRHGETLIQRRHSDKRLWPGYWSNGCCSHPRNGEIIEDAVVRRAEQELGLSVNPDFLFKFRYRATYLAMGSEFELCSVFVSHTADEPNVNATEIAEWRWVAPHDLDREIENDSITFTPWLQIEWKRMRTEFLNEIQSLGAE